MVDRPRLKTQWQPGQRPSWPMTQPNDPGSWWPRRTKAQVEPRPTQTDGPMTGNDPDEVDPVTEWTVDGQTKSDPVNDPGRQPSRTKQAQTDELTQWTSQLVKMTVVWQTQASGQTKTQLTHWRTVNWRIGEGQPRRRQTQTDQPDGQTNDPDEGLTDDQTDRPRAQADNDEVDRHWSQTKPIDRPGRQLKTMTIGKLANDRWRKDPAQPNERTDPMTAGRWKVGRQWMTQLKDPDPDGRSNEGGRTKRRQWRLWTMTKAKGRRKTKTSEPSPDRQWS